MVEYLKKILQREDTVLFIGSGISLWSGLPTWAGLLDELVVFMESMGLDASLVRKEKERGDLLLAASYGFNKLTKPQIRDFIAIASRLGKCQPHEIHQKLVTLGPTCFVTTNYDKLLELSFAKWQPDTYYRTVLNKQLTEAGEIKGARASHFLFKLHGDAESADSIILTREQYRTFNLGGDLYHALETIKTLMVSRPFVYIGFGLRDPDFLYVKDILSNIYEGGARDHYAIVADIGQEEKDYWRESYGIHLVNYNTGHNGHADLLTLLDQLGQKPVATAKPIDITEAAFILTLARHAEEMSRFEKAPTHIPLMANFADNNPDKDKWVEIRKQYSRTPIEQLLTQGPAKLVLTGLPGGGKSYALKSSAAYLATNMRKTLFSEPFEPEQLLVPLIVDLKLYTGSIIALLEQTLPAGISVDFLHSHFKIKVFFDAFNEMPREYIDSGVWDTDLSNFLLRMPNAALVISSRTSDGLRRYPLPIFNLHNIDHTFVEKQLDHARITLHGSFKREMTALLQTPFFYKLVFESRFRIDETTSPYKLYDALLTSVNNRFRERFKTTMDLLPALSEAAMAACNTGQEAFGIGILEKAIADEQHTHDSTAFLPLDIINWLVSQEFVLPLPGKRICFFHQSITEYLAASLLAITFEKDPTILKQKFKYTDWDEVVLLTLSFLEKEKAEQFIGYIAKIDFSFAASAMRYVQSDDKEILIAKLLEEAGKQGHGLFSFTYLHKEPLQLTERHIPLLRTLVAQGGSTGADAIYLLSELLGDQCKEEYLPLLVEKCGDYMFCANVAEHMSSIITTDADLGRLKNMADQVQEKILQGYDQRCDNFCQAIGQMMVKFEPAKVAALFYHPGTPKGKQTIDQTIFSYYLRFSPLERAVTIAADMLLKDDESSLGILYGLSGRASHSLDSPVFTPAHVQKLAAILRSRKPHESYLLPITIIESLCQARKDLLPYFRREAESCHGMLKVTWEYCLVQNDDYTAFFKAWEDLLALEDKVLKKEPVAHAACFKDVNWNGQEQLLMKIFQRRNEYLARVVCRGIAFSMRELDLELDIGPIDWWLDWFLETWDAEFDEESNYISSVVANNIDYDKREEFINEFNDRDSPYRFILMRTIIGDLKNIMLEELSEESISFLLDEKNDPSFSHACMICVRIADEDFVTNRLLPLLETATGEYREGIIETIELIGDNYGIRFL